MIQFCCVQVPKEGYNCLYGKENGEKGQSSWQLHQVVKNILLLLSD